jgi:signal transduction histidine kinase
VPRSFQARLTVAFMGVVALTLLLVAPVIINRIDDYVRQQEEQSLAGRADAIAEVLGLFIRAQLHGVPPVTVRDDKATLNPALRATFQDPDLLRLFADTVGRADIAVEFGPAHPDSDGQLVPDPDPQLRFTASLDVPPDRGQARDPGISPQRGEIHGVTNQTPWGLVVTLSNPYTNRGSTLATITGLFVVMASLAFLVAVLIAAYIAHRFTTPLTRLTEASRRLAEGDLTSRVAPDEVASGTIELEALSRQFNTMADRLQQSVEIIRGDRDRSRDFLADVSHELRTPIAAMRVSIDLLQGPAGMDPAARSEFLEQSAVQLDRLDWLAQNLLELSKLDSGLVLLDLRPDDVRATIESAVEQQQAAAERRGIALRVQMPSRPLRIRHDGPRISQVVTNLVNNALKFTGPGGQIDVVARPAPDGGARIEVRDTGVGIDESELPLIFDRFYRGAVTNRERSTGSGLGLAIVKSIVDMHHGTIAVESRVRHGSRFVVTLPRDPTASVEPAAQEQDADVVSTTGTPPLTGPTTPAIQKVGRPHDASAPEGG